MNTDDPSALPAFSKAQVQATFNRAADSYDGAAIVQLEVCKRLLERLDYIKIKPQIILDLGTGTGQGVQGLAEQYPEAGLIAMDLAPRMLHKCRQRLKPSGLTDKLRRAIRANRYHYVCADAERLPLPDASVDLIFSNLTIQWCTDLVQLFQEFRRVLKPGGLLLFTTFGTDTLKELRASWAAVSDKVHVNEFTDMHDIGDILYNVQTENPVMDSERIVLNYPSVKKIMLDLKAVGAHNQNRGRETALTGKQRFKAMLEQYEQFKTADGYPLTYEVVYGHAWNPKTPLQNTHAMDNGQQTSISMAQLKSTLKSKEK